MFTAKAKYSLVCKYFLYFRGLQQHCQTQRLLWTHFTQFTVILPLLPSEPLRIVAVGSFDIAKSTLTHLILYYDAGVTVFPTERIITRKMQQFLATKSRPS